MFKGSMTEWLRYPFAKRRSGLNSCEDSNSSASVKILKLFYE